MDEFQIKAINHQKGPGLVLAGPGSGKTTVIVNRLVKLVKEYKVKPEVIVAISFTRASSLELKKRSCSAHPPLEKVRFGTFHSFFLSILKESGIYDYRNVLDEEEKNRILKEILQKELSARYVAKEVVDILRKEISSGNTYMNQSISKNHSVNQSQPMNISPSAQNLIGRVSEQYERYKQKENKIDFEDILHKTKELLTTDINTIARLKSKFRYYFIDEFQDINQTQFDVVKLLLDEEQNIFAVGDEDQSIYGFRGASPIFITEFQRFFEQAAIYRILNSYRCPSQILQLSNRLIQKNIHRTDKNIISAKNQQGSILIHSFADIKAQTKYIRNRILQGKTPGDFMVIYRTNAQALPLIQELSDSNIPFNVKDYSFHLFRHFIYQDMVAYMSLALVWNESNPKTGIGNEIKWLNQIQNKPFRSLKPIMNYDKINKHNIYDYLKQKHQISLTKKVLFPEIQKINPESFEKSIDIILMEIGYLRYLENYGKHYGIPTESFMEVIERIKEIVTPAKDISSALHEMDLLQKVNDHLIKDQKSGGNKVLLTTAHGAKGLERNHVFIISLNQGIFPHRRGMEDHLEEERRLLYVAMTRSKQNLEISYIDDSKNKEYLRSLFLSDMGI